MDIDDILERLDQLSGALRACVLEIDQLETDLIAEKMEEDLEDVKMGEELDDDEPDETATPSQWAVYCRAVELAELIDGAVPFVKNGIAVLERNEGDQPHPPLPTALIELVRAEIVSDDEAKHYYVCGIFETNKGPCVIGMECAKVGNDLVSIIHDHWAWDTEWKHRLRELGSDVPAREAVAS